MSTRSNVSILNPNGSVTTQYFHMDGGLTFTGQNLLDNYRTLDDAKKLIETGNYNDNHIPENPTAATKLMDEYNSNGQRIDDPVRKQYHDLSAMINDISKNDGKYLNSDVEYHYLFSPSAEGNYQWHTINRNGIKPLTQKVIDSEKESGTLADVDWNKSSFTSDWAAPLTDKEISSLNDDISLQSQYLDRLQKSKPELVSGQVKDKMDMDKNALKSERRPRKTFDRKAWKKKHTQTVEDLKNGLLKEVDNYTQSPEKVVEMLDFMDKFHNYSSRNAMMIQMQRPGATAVGSFAKFKSMGYKVNRGEKGIKIFVPTKATVFYRKNKDGNKELANLKTATKDEKQKIEAGNIETYQKTFYKIGTVFDAPQTNMPKEKYPELYPNRHQDFNMKNPGQIDSLENGLRSVANDMKMPVITYDPFNADIRDKYKDPQNAKGYFNRATNEIVLNGYNTPTENVSVLAHELGHAQLHNSQKQEKDLPRELKEMQAELTSYLYCSHYGIDVKQETVDYIANWTSNGQKFNELPSGVKGQILTHVGSATKTLTNSTDKLLEKEQEKLGQIVKENFLDTPEHSQWYVQKEKMEQEVTDNETNGTNFKTELTALRKIEKSMTVDTVRNLDDAFNKTQCWTADGNYSKLTDNLQNEIEKNQEKSKLLDDKEVQTSKPHVATVNSSLTNEKAKEIAIQKGEQELDR